MHTINTPPLFILLLLCTHYWHWLDVTNRCIHDSFLR